MEARNWLSNIVERIARPEPTKNTYSYPVSRWHIKRIEKDPPENTHTGVQRGAIDFIVDLDTPVSAPASGIVVKVVDDKDRFGTTPDFAEDLNYITIAHKNGEQSQLAHLAKGSSEVNEGEEVYEGQIIAKTGNSGYMTEPHLHFIVFSPAPNKQGYKSREVRFKK